MTILDQIKKELHAIDYDCAIEPASDEIPWDRLLIYLGKDEKDRERILEITVQEQELGEELSEFKFPSISRIQFIAPLPFTIHESAFSDTADLILFLNKMMELPGFEMDELEGKMQYRYPLMTVSDPVPKELYLGIIGIISIFLNLYAELLEKIATGEMSYDELLQQILKTAQEFEERP